MRDLSNLHEDKIAVDIGGKRSANSGAGVLKGDVFNKDWCVEGKASLTPDFKLDIGLVAKTNTEALTRQKKPAISFMLIAGDPHVPRSLRIVSYVYLIPAPLRNKRQRYVELPLTHLIDEWIALEGTVLRLRVPAGVPPCWRISTPASARVLLGRRAKSSRDG